MWFSNIIMYSLLYWQVDRGGCCAQGKGTNACPDWYFPQAEFLKDTPGGWMPTYINYLYLSFSAATSFSPNSALPLSGRSMILMMFESIISIVTIVVVAARAINILGM